MRPPVTTATRATGGADVGGALAQPLDDAREPFGVDGLQQVVERLDGEGLERVSLVRGDEHDGGRIVRPRARARRRRAPVRPGISTSRKTTSGRADRVRAIASAAPAASPAISISGWRESR